MTLGFWAYFKLSKNYEEENKKAAAKTNDKLSFKEILKVFLKNRHIVGLMLADFTSNLSQTMSPALAVYFCKYVAQDSYLLPKMLLINSVCSMVGAATIGKICKKESLYKRNLLIIIYSIIACVALSLKFAGFNIMLFVVLYAVMHFFTAMSQPMEAASYMDVAIYHEWLTNKNATSFIVSLTYIPFKISGIIKWMLLTFTLIAAGYVAGAAPTPELKMGIVNACSIVPIITSVFGISALSILYRLAPNDISKMKSEIKGERKLK